MIPPTRFATVAATLSRTFLGAIFALSTLLAAPVDAAREQALPRSSIGVAPFGSLDDADADVPAVPDVARLLAGELERKSASKVVSPERMKLGDDDPLLASPAAAGAIRRWADLNEVDTIVVGRAARAKGGGLNIDVELRSGHSGAPEAEYRLEPASDPELPSAVEKLATLILADLRDAEPAPFLPAVSASRAAKRGSKADSSEGED